MVLPNVAICTLTFALVGSSLGGCTGVCQGPGCEDTFPGARLSLVDPTSGPNAEALPAEIVLPDQATATWIGSVEEVDEDEIQRVDEGTDWATAFLGSDLLIGQPGAERVVRVAMATGDTSVEPLTIWQSVASDFGTSVFVHARDPVLDLWVGAPRAGDRLGPADGTAPSRGAFYVFRDVASISDTSIEADRAPLLVIGASASDRLGTHITSCFDLTGDGVAEIAIGAPWFTTPDTGTWPFEEETQIPELAGAVFLLESEKLATAEGTLFPWELGRVWWGEQAGAGFGQALTCDEDLYVGAPWHVGARGRVYLLPGDALPESGAITEANTLFDGPESGAWFGASVSTLRFGTERGVAVGSPGFGGGSGKAYIYTVDDDDLTAIATFVQPDHVYADHFARTMAAADIDGDGVHDLVMGGPDHRISETRFDVGRIWIWPGNQRTTWGLDADVAGAPHQIGGTQPFMRIGRNLAVGDPDNDGFDTLLIPTRAAAAQ